MKNPCEDCLVYPICLQRYLSSYNKNYRFIATMRNCKLCYDYINYQIKIRLGNEYKAVMFYIEAIDFEHMTVPFYKKHISKSFKIISVPYVRE